MKWFSETALILHAKFYIENKDIIKGVKVYEEIDDELDRIISISYSALYFISIQEFSSALILIDKCVSFYSNLTRQQESYKEPPDTFWNDDIPKAKKIQLTDYSELYRYININTISLKYLINYFFIKYFYFGSFKLLKK